MVSRSCCTSFCTKKWRCEVFHYLSILCEGGTALLVRILNSRTGFSFTLVSVMLYFGCPFSITGLPFLSSTCVLVLTVFSTWTVRSLRIPVNPLSFGCAIYLNLEIKSLQSFLILTFFLFGFIKFPRRITSTQIPSASNNACPFMIREFQLLLFLLHM